MGRNLLSIAKEIDENMPPIEEMSKDDIAIIGMAVKMPMAENIDEFWTNLKKGTDCITDFPQSRRVDSDKYLRIMGKDESLLKYYQGAFLNEIDKFDYKFFKFSPKEANLADPTQKLFLETVWQAIEDAGYGGTKLSGSGAGVYLGFEPPLLHSYAAMDYDLEHASIQQALPGNIPAIIPSRISYILDLKGPAMFVDTACSSSLVALHLACQGLKTGDCSTAIVGGIKIFLFPVDDPDEKIGIESSDYKTKSFDENSNGTGIGEGVAALLIKPLIKAVKDQDHIYAVIKGSAVNQDGNSASLTAPSALAQADVIEQAWKKTGINPETISYIEAHGTGTKIGDPIEMDGIQKAFRRYTDKKQFAGIGSVKTNIGHLFEGSGIAGIIKCALALKYGELPPTIHFEMPNRKIDFEQSPVYVVDKLIPWKTEGYPRRCGVNAFGFSGTNCHAILEEPPVLPETNRAHDGETGFVCTLSAKSQTALHELIARFRDFLNRETVGLKEMCYITNTGRGHYNLRLAIPARSFSELKEKISGLTGIDSLSEGVYYGEHQIVGTKVITGQNETTREHLSEISKAKISIFMDRGRKDFGVLEEICQLYVSGADIDWNTLYCDDTVQKIRLPVYPFDKTRCWIDILEIKPEFEDTGLYYSIIWRQEAIGTEIPEFLNENIMVIKNAGGGDFFREEAVLYLKEKCKTLIEVEVGTEYSKIDENRFMVRNTEEDYLHLLNEVKARGLDAIIHALSLNNKAADGLDELTENLNKGVYSLFYFARALNRALITNEIKFFTVSSYASPVTKEERTIRPENAALFGLARVFERENPQVHCKCIDMDDQVHREMIFQELTADFTSGQIAYRNGLRYIEEFSEIDLSEYNAQKKVEIKEDGVYLITGGAGGIGLEIAKFLAGKNPVHLVLINRSKLPDRETWPDIANGNEDGKLSDKIKAFLDIEKNGSRVSYYSADISNAAEVKEIFSDLQRRSITINGVIHGAGVAPEKLMVLTDEQAFKKVINPKIYGAWLLDNLTQDYDLDFFVMFSSVATIFSAPGQGDYAAANSYLDSFASLLNQRGRKALSIDWVQWLETGMAVDAKANINTLVKALPSAQGVHAFAELLNTDLHRALAGEMNYGSEMFLLLEKVPIKLSSKINHNLEIQKSISAKTKHQPKKHVGEVILKGRDNGVYSDVEKTTARIWGEVLGYDTIGIHDNFFELGGDSISAIKICNKISLEIGKNFAVSNALEYLTISEVAQYIEKTQLEVNTIYATLKPVAKRDYYPLSSAQKRLFTIYQMAPSSLQYNLPEIYIMKDGFDTNKFEKTIHELIRRHEILRTSFLVLRNEVVQVVHDVIPLKITYIESEKGCQPIIDSLRNESMTPFDLENPPLFRIDVIKLKNGEHIIFVDKHHIIWDAVSKSIFFNEFRSLYQGKSLPEPELQYKDYAVWQQELRVNNLLQKQLEFWLNQFSDPIPVLVLPTDYPRPQTKTQQGDTIFFATDRKIAGQLNELAKQNETTIYPVLLASFYVLLAKYSGQEDMIVGSVTVGRGQYYLENTIGMFVNTIPLRNYPAGEKSFRKFLGEVRVNVLKAFENQETQFEELVERLPVKRDPDRHPLFDVMFVLQNVKLPENEQFVLVELEDKTSKFDLTLEAAEYEDTIHFKLEYNTGLFKRETVMRMADDYLKILEITFQNQEICIKQINLRDNYHKEKRVIGEDVGFDF